MTLLFCVDDRLGLAFHGRRQSRDSAVCRDILALAAGRPLHLHPRSMRLFAGMEGDLRPAEEFPAAEIAEGDFCFLEFTAPDALLESASALVVYHWGRHYPADQHFTMPASGWRLEETREFPGSSHECIKREVYAREAI